MKLLRYYTVWLWYQTFVEKNTSAKPLFEIVEILFVRLSEGVMSIYLASNEIDKFNKF